MELVIAMVMIGIIFAAILPQFALIRNSWDVKQGTAEALQNGRVLMDHISRNLSKAVRIADVSESDDADGYIEFEDNDANIMRYDISANNYVEFGAVGNLADLAGPVSSLTFTCYDACDLDTALSPVTDTNDIRVIKVVAVFVNSGSLGRNETFTTWVYLRANSQSEECWSDEDIGDVASAGNATFADCDWTVIGSGYDIWNSTDEFHYVYRALAGDGQIVARVVSMTNTDQWAKAGVMIRETLTGGSKHAMMVVTPGNGTAFQRRTTTDGSSTHTAGSSVVAPYWVKLVRIGDTFYGYESPDGADWTLVDSDTITMATDVYIGLCVTSHNDGDLCTAEFDNVSFLTYEGFTEAKVSTDDTSITIPTPGSAGSVSILGSWVEGTSHTQEAGSNRALVFIAHVEESGSIDLSSVTYGGQPMTKAIDEIVGSSYRAYVAAFILDEAGIAAATSDTFVPAWSTTPDNVSYGSVFLDNVNQADLVGASDSAGTASSTPNPITTSALSTNDGDMVIVAATCGNTSNYTVNNGFTEAVELDMASSTGVEGYKLATGADETPSVTNTNVNRQVIIGFVVNGGGEVGGIEGDLLIAAVATDGSTTISPPLGWTEITQGSYSSDVTLGAWWKIAETSESSGHTFTWSGGQQAYGWMMHFTGQDPANPINAWSANGQTSSTPTSPAVTTTADGCIILRLGAFDDGDISEDDPGLSDHAKITMDKTDGGDITLFQDGFESGFTNWTRNGWDQSFTAHSGTYSAHADRYDSYLISDNINTSAYSSFILEFWYRLNNTESGDAYLYLYDGSNYDYDGEFGTDAEGTWLQYQETITDSQYLKSNFRVRFEASMNNNGEDIWIDDVTVTAVGNGAVSGGAGYIRQATAGDSGTSNFSLTASNEAQMITIAIAPDGDVCCDGQLRP